jgi:hypothetical protein
MSAGEAMRWYLILFLVLPLMGFTFGSSPSAASEAPRIRVVSYNIGKSGDRFPAALAQIRQFSPDIVVVQAVYEREESALKAEFRGWTLHVEGQWVMATRFPLREAWVPPPLMYAAGNGEAAVVEVLLRAGADPAARNEGGRTALMMVKDRDYVDVINILHEAELQLGGEGCGTRNAPNMQVVTFLKKTP